MTEDEFVESWSSAMLAFRDVGRLNAREPFPDMDPREPDELRRQKLANHVRMQMRRFDPVLRDLQGLRPPTDELKELQEVSIEIIVTIKREMEALTDAMEAGEPLPDTTQFEDRMIALASRMNDIVERLGVESPELREFLESMETTGSPP